MKFGVMLPHTGNNASAGAIRDVAQAAEELGFASLWASDHIAMPRRYEPKYPFSEDGRFPMPEDRPFLDFFQSLAFAAAVTRHVQLGVSVCIVPYRHPALLAKSVATLDTLAEGRLLFGVGIGWLKEEFALLGAPFHRRGRLTDESLEFCLRAWSPDQPVTFQGEFVTAEEVYFSPRPFEDRPVTVWVGGTSDAALRRAARFASVWQPHLYGADPERIRRNLARIDELKAQRGQGERVRAALYLPIALVDSDPGDASPPWERRMLTGTPAGLRDALSIWADAGIEHVLFAFGGTTGAKLATMETLMREVCPDLGPVAS